MSQAALALEESNSRQLLVELATDARSLRAAQALRYQVFAEECGAVLHTAEAGLDQDHYDLHCEHLIVRDQNTGRVVATTRILDSRRAPEAAPARHQNRWRQWQRRRRVSRHRRS